MTSLVNNNNTQSTTTYLETVQTGYLGEYTDITVQELFDGYYQTMLGCEAAWDGGETEEGKQIVQVTYSSADMDDTTIRNRKIKGRIETKNEVCHNVYGTHGELP